MYADELLLPWLERLRGSVPGLAEPFDAHTHIGANDPDGFKVTADELVTALARVDARAAVFPMHEPEGYRAANDAVLAAAREADGRLIPFCRLDPRRDGLHEARRCLDAGARGLKLHPRAERFALSEPGVDELIALAGERRLPVIVHSGRGIPSLGRDALTLAERYPGARIVLAHMGISDLTWLAREASGHPNIYFDTSWWSAADALALFAAVPPGQVLYASDVPFGAPVQSLIHVCRCGLQAGLHADQLAAVCGGQMRRLVAGDEPLDLGPPPGRPATALDPVLQRVHTYLACAFGVMFDGGDGLEHRELARLAAAAGGEGTTGAALASIGRLLDEAGGCERAGASQDSRFRALHLVVTADAVALTPDVPLPA
jgi:predicted TIM-barrel fold metal-dependent hydrolase